MPKLTTVGEFRSLMIANEGKVEIGAFKIVMRIDPERKTDVDIYINGDLIAWLSSGAEDTDLLSEAMVSVSNDLKELKKTNEALVEQADRDKKDIRTLRADLEKVQQNQVDNGLLKGQVEAYEKMLIGRGVTISA